MPTFDAKVRSNGGRIQIFDRFRNKYVALTPEEWVRQHFAHYLHSTLGYPVSSIMVEYELQYNGMKKRPDIGVIDTYGSLFLLAECKAPQVALTEDVFLQLSTYFAVTNAAFIALTNGLQHIYARIEPNSGNCVYMKELPPFA